MKQAYTVFKRQYKNAMIAMPLPHKKKVCMIFKDNSNITFEFRTINFKFNKDLNEKRSMNKTMIKTK